MIYSGWHLAAAVLRASRPLPRPVMAGTSGAYGELEMLKTTTHRLGQKTQFDSILFPADLSRIALPLRQIFVPSYRTQCFPPTHALIPV